MRIWVDVAVAAVREDTAAASVRIEFGRIGA